MQQLSRKIIRQTPGTTLPTASTLRESYQFSLWDSLIVGSALQHQCDLLYSEDMQDGLVAENRLQIVNPFTLSP